MILRSIVSFPIVFFTELECEHAGVQFKVSSYKFVKSDCYATYAPNGFFFAVSVPFLKIILCNEIYHQFV